MTQEQLIPIIRAHIKEHHGKQYLAADHWGMRKEYLTRILGNHKPVPPQILDDLGLIRKATYTYEDKQ